MDSYVLLLSSLLLPILYFCLFIKKKTQLPPGPTGLPILGSLLTVGKRPHESLSKLSQTYGPLMTVKLGMVNVVVASSSEMAKEILLRNDQSFLGRPTPESVAAGVHYDMSLVWSSGHNPHWKTLRRICNTQLFTTQKLDAVVHLRHQMVREMIRRAGDAGEPVDVGRLVFETSLNLLSNTFFSGDVFGAKSVEMREVISQLVELALKPNIADFVPCLRRFDPQGIRRKITAVYGRMNGLLGEVVSRRVDRRKNRSDGCGDFLDVLLDQGELTHQNIVILLQDLFVAGTHPTSITMEWAMAELLRNPAILAKLKRELSDKIPAGKLVEERDISGLVYLNAIIKETMRLHPLLPLLMPHLTEQPVQFHGYTIPKHTQVFVNVWSIQRDPTKWPDPTSFKPERFEGVDSVEIRGAKDFRFIPFGGGRRICPGSNLAVRMLSLMLANLVHGFEGWELPNGLKPEEMDMTEGFGMVLSKREPVVAVPIKA